jgi:hypothetical protein
MMYFQDGYTNLGANWIWANTPHLIKKLVAKYDGQLGTSLGHFRKSPR